MTVGGRSRVPQANAIAISTFLQRFRDLLRIFCVTEPLKNSLSEHWPDPIQNSILISSNKEGARALAWQGIVELPTIILAYYFIGKLLI